MPLQPIDCNEALDAKLTVERVRPNFVLLQVLGSRETLRADLAHIVPVRLQVLLVVLTRMLLQLVPDRQEFIYFCCEVLFCYMHLLTKL